MTVWDLRAVDSDVPAEATTASVLLMLIAAPRPNALSSQDSNFKDRALAVATPPPQLLRLRPPNRCHLDRPAA
eukprot:4068988-Alexandrium_andersonii.AAC.1